jgi:hypothetical protein
MKTNNVGDVCFATLAVGCPMFERLAKCEEQIYDNFEYVQPAQPTASLGINAYNIVRLPSPFGNSIARLVTQTNL